MRLPFFNNYPYTNFEQLNLDWMMEKIGGFDARITDNTNKITTERSERIVADDALRAAIEAEAAARAAADTALQSNITAEATARTAADDSLSSRITAEVNARTAADTLLQGNIDAEVAARTAADTTLQNNITAEAGARAAADTALTNLINGKFSVVEVTSDQGVWSITSDNWADVFDLTKNVLLHHAQAGLYLLRDEYEVHGSVITAVFSAVDVGVEDVSTTVEGETFNFEDLEYVGGNKFTVTSIDGGETITSVAFKNVHVNNVLDLICEDRLSIDAVKPVIIEITASGPIFTYTTTYSTSFDDWSSLIDANDVMVVITDPNDNVVKAHAINVTPEYVQFLLLDDEGTQFIMNIETDITPASISVIENAPVIHNDIWVSYDATTQEWYVREGDTSLISDEDRRTVIINNDDPTHVEQYLVTRAGRNAAGTGAKIYFGNYFCETDSVTNKPKLVYKQYIFEWNSNTSEYDITYDTFEIGSAT